jgi:cytochrome P450
MTYFDDVFKETLRMSGPAVSTFGRITRKVHYIDKIPINKNVVMSVLLIPNHYKE